MSKGADFFNHILLTDSEGNRSKIIAVHGGESGLDHLEVITQSKAEKEQGTATRHRIYSDEVMTDAGLENLPIEMMTIQ